MAIKTKELLNVTKKFNNSIPSHWELVKIKEIGSILNGFAFQSKFFNSEKGIPIIRIRDLNKTTTEKLYEGDYNPNYLVEKDDILIGMDGDFKCIRWNGSKGLLNQRVCKITINEDFMVPNFFLFAINRYLKEIHSATSFLTVTHLSSYTIEDIKFPLPPLNEQKRIVAKIEELFSILDHANNSLEFNILQIVRCKQAILKKVVEETLTQDGICTNLQKVCIKVTDGTHNPPKFITNGIPFVFVGDIVDGKLSLETKKFITLEDYQFLSKRCPIEVGDILYSVVGSYGVAVQVDTQKQFQFQRHISLLKPNPKFLNSEYLVFIMNSPFVLSQAHKASRGVAQKTINLGDLRQFLIPCPPLEEQRKIVKKILLQFSLLDNLLEITKSELIRIKNTYIIILKLAFEGKLVLQDPNDEPASELLNTIKVTVKN